MANIALHGLENRLKDFAKTLDIRKKDKPNSQVSWQTKVSSLTFIRYADDFVLIHQDLKVVQRCRDLISKWLKDMGLELKPSKTRIAHTLKPELSEDGQAGFDFLGYHIQQFPAGKYNSPRNTHREILGFKTLITPTTKSSKKHQESIRRTIRKHKNSSQALLIKELNPIIRGWCNYYQFSDAQTVNALTRQDYLVFQKLRAWGKRRCGNLKDARKQYYTKIGKRDWIFATRKENGNLFWLLSHSNFGSSSNNYVKVKGEASPYNGNLVYWSTRMGKNPEMPQRKAIMLKKQKGKCNWCGLHFRETDVLEEDHILATALGGKNEYNNLQLLHGHCHDEKTAIDLMEIRTKQCTQFYEKLSREWAKVKFIWIDDIPVIVDC